MSDNHSSNHRRVVVIDDHALFSQGLAVLLEDEASFARVVATTTDPGEAEGLIEQHDPDLVVVDLKLPEENGIELIRRLRRRWPELRALVMSSESHPKAVLAALVAGAVGYVPKHHHGVETVAAICAASAGFHVFSPTVMPSIREVSRVPPNVTIDDLDDEERELWRLLCRDDLTHSDIADRVNVSVSTLKRNASALFDRLEVSGRLGAAMLAGRFGVFDRDG